jgi:hypothetical protein
MISPLSRLPTLPNGIETLFQACWGHDDWGGPLLRGGPAITGNPESCVWLTAGGNAHALGHPAMFPA